jgi:HD superfamily phosphohydrolase YqeK
MQTEQQILSFIEQDLRFVFDKDLITKLAIVTKRSFELLKTDEGHNFDNHSIPVLKNIVDLLIESNYRGQYSTEVMCAGLLHDRNRFFLGHFPTTTIQRAIMNSLNIDLGFQNRVLEIISTHSELVQTDPFKEEKEVLFLADKKEFVNWNRAETALKTMPRILVKIYKKEWIKRIPDIEEKVLGFRDKYPKFVGEFEMMLSISKEKLGV